MAERRMVSKKIIDSDAFMDMALSTQALYFHLLARADDDGFVGNPKKIMRMIGASEDEYKILIAKRFILSFPSGICVIKHWYIHNYIQSDRYTKTQYIEEKNTLELKENRSYTECIQDVSTLDTQIRLDKIRLDKIRHMPVDETIDDEFWLEYPEKVAKAKAYQIWKKMTDDEKKLAIEAIKKQVNNNHFRGKDGKDYIPHPATWLNQKRWEDEVKVKEKLETIKLDKYGNITK